MVGIWLVAPFGVMRAQDQNAAAPVEVAMRGPRFLSGFGPGAAAINPARVETLGRRVSLHAGETTVGVALRDLARQSGVRLLYSRDVVPLEAHLRLDESRVSLAAALTEVLLDAGVDVAVGGNGQLVLVRRAEAESPATGTVLGRVTALAGSPLVGATVVVLGTPRSASTGNDGRYQIADVPPGTYTLRARYIGYAPSTAPVTVTGGQEATVDFALEKSAQQLDEVVTTGTIVPTEVRAIPTPVSVIDENDIARQGPRTIQSLLRQAVPTAVSWDFPSAPGSTTFSTRGASTLDIGGAQMKVFIDGIEVASASGAAVDPNSIEHIEVIRGPQAAAIYGSAAIGGVIQIFTKRGDPSLTRPQGDAQAAFGMIQTPNPGYGTVVRQSYAASVRGGGPDGSYNFGAGYSRTPDYVQPVTAQSTPSAYGGMHLARGIVAVDLTGRYYILNNPFAFNPALEQTGFPSFSKPDYQSQQNGHQSLGARITVAPTSWWQNSLTAGVDRDISDVAQTQPRLTTPADTLLEVFNFGSTKTSIGYTTTVHGALGASMTGSVTAGFDHYYLLTTGWFAFGAQQTTGAITTDPNNPPEAERDVTNNTGYFGQVQLGFRDVLFLTAGLRAEQNTNFGDSLGTPLSPRVGVSFVQPVGGATLKLRGSWGRAIRPPSPGEKLASAQPGYVQLANPVLGPERQHGWDAGADLTFGARGSLSLTYYNQTAQNLIDLVQQQPVPTPTYEYQNVGRVKNTGVEVEGTLSLGVAQLKAQYGYARARIEQLAPGYTGVLILGDQALATPKHTAGATLTLAPRHGTTFTAGATHVGSWNMFDYLAEFGCFGGTAPCQPSFRDYVVSYPAFTKFNAAIWQQLTPLVTGFVSVENLTNRSAAEYENLEATIGRVSTVGLRVTF